MQTNFDCIQQQNDKHTDTKIKKLEIHLNNNMSWNTDKIHVDAILAGKNAMEFCLKFVLTSLWHQAQ